MVIFSCSLHNVCFILFDSGSGCIGFSSDTTYTEYKSAGWLLRSQSQESQENGRERDFCKLGADVEPLGDSIRFNRVVILDCLTGADVFALRSHSSGLNLKL